MVAFLATLIFFAAGEVKPPPPPPPIPDSEVVRYLKSNELVEWSNAMRLNSSGENRVKMGQSIMTVSGTVAATNKGPKIGGLTETPEQVKARAQKMIDDGSAQIKQALPSLTRLRAAAAFRAAESTKPISFDGDLPSNPWNIAVTQSVARLQKQARDAGYAKVHFIGSIKVLGDGKLARPLEMTDEIRAAWITMDDRPLAPVPTGGYAYVPGLDKVPASFSKEIKPAEAPRQVALVWAEYYAVSAGSQRGLLFLRMADANTMRLIASDVAYTEIGALFAPDGKCTYSLRDERSFIPRLGDSGDWVLGFDRESNPLGSAILAHISVAQSKLGIAAAPYVAIVTGSGVASPEGIRAKWRVALLQSSPGKGDFQVTSIPAGAGSVEVGQLSLAIVVPPVAK